MPLIIITGLPCSGKSHRAREIAQSLNTFISSSSDPSISRRTVQIIPSQHASSDPDLCNETTCLDDHNTTLRDQIYTSASAEKNARAAEFSAIKRGLSKDNIVIADGLNYIKGYRYQLWCEAKAAGTRCCVVHAAAREDECKRWNRERLRVWGREEEEEEDAVGQNNSAKQGENVFGELKPESHTAIYGDCVVDKENGNRSRFSSMDGNEDGEVVPRSRPSDETMTLKSLYITDPIPAATNSPSRTTTTTPRPDPSSSATTNLQLSSTPTASTSSLPIPPPTSSHPYSPATMTSLNMRYEPPSPFSRWDTPLFTVPSTDAAPPVHDIWLALYPPPAKPTSKKALSQLSAAARSPTTINGAQKETGDRATAAAAAVVKPHAATVLAPATASDALQTLESATMDVVKHLLAQARLQLHDGEGGGDVTLSIPSPGVSGSGDEAEADTIDVTMHVPSGIALSQPMLQRLRRKYTQIQRGSIAHGQGYISGRRKVVLGFVGFLEGEWEDE